MKNKYMMKANRLWLALVWLMSVALATQAQTVQPPVIEWQQVIEPNRGPIDSPPRVTKADDGGFAVATGSELIRLSPLGNVSWRSNIRQVIGLSAPEQTSYRANVVDVATTQGGGFVVLVTTGFNDQSGGFTIAKVDAGGSRVWSTTVESNRFRDEIFSGVSVLSTADGGFLTVGTHTKFLFYQFVILTKFDGNGNRLWGKELRFPYPANGIDGPGYTEAHRAILLADGNVLLVGETRRSLSNGTRGWAARVDGSGNTIWQKRYEDRVYLDDVDENATAVTGYIVIGATESNSTATLGIDLDGEVSGNSLTESDRLVGTTSAIAAMPASNGKSAYYSLLDVAAANNGDFRLTNVTSPDQTIAWTKTLGGSGADAATDLLPITDGYLLVGTTTSTDGDVQGKSENSRATWIVKLKNATPATALGLTQPGYNCQTGFVTFITTGGDGSLITYNAPGVARSSATSNTGTVEPGLRNDPKPITITATQNGQTASFTFDFNLFCNRPNRPLPPVVVSPIPDQTLTVGTEITINNPVRVDQYFMDPTQARSAGYRPFLRFRLVGLPPGLLFYDQSRELLPFGFFAGTPTTTGVYTVTATAVSENIAAPDNSVSTTFKITVVDKTVVNPPTPPAGGTLALTQPSYNCQTGAIAFNVTGGDGSPITYNAPGISRTSLTSNSGTVEPGLRNDPKPITITATQNGQTASFTFDLAAFCSGTQPPVDPPTTPTGGTLTLLAPTYDCGTGAITFRTSGGNGSVVEYAAAGITGWTTNPNQFVDRDSRTANDVKPFTLMARQSGVLVTFDWDLKAACGRARVGVGERMAELSVSVLGNPVSDVLTVEVQGAANQPLSLRLLDGRGRLVESRSVEQAGAAERQRFDVHQQGPGLLLLRVNSGSQTRTVKIMKR